MDSLPLISCIMPTRNRSAFVTQAVTYFLGQDYPNKELLIVDDSESAEWTCSYPSADIQSVYITETLTTGMKRNIAVSMAKGDIICHWDDDDLFGPQRLSKQVQYLLNYSTIGMTGLRTGAIVDIDRWQAWTISDTLHAEMFHANIHGGTLMYWKRLWEQSAYPNVQVGEDAEFMRRALPPGMRILQVPNDGDFVYIRHGENAWDVTMGEHLGSEGWQQVRVEDYIPEEHLAFYAGLRTKEAV